MFSKGSSIEIPDMRFHPWFKKDDKTIISLMRTRNYCAGKIKRLNWKERTKNKKETQEAEPKKNQEEQKGKKENPKTKTKEMRKKKNKQSR